MVNPMFAILGGVLLLLGNVECILGVRRHRIRPNRVSWAIWTVPAIACCAAQVQARVGLAAVLTFAIAIGSLLVLLATFHNGLDHVRLGLLDWCCAVLAAAMTVFWAVTRDPNITVVMLIATDWLGGLPTFVKAYRDPRSESRPAFLLFALGSGVTLLAVHNWNLLNYGVPTHGLIMAFTIFVIITLPRRTVAGRTGCRKQNTYLPSRGPLRGDRRPLSPVR